MFVVGPLSIWEYSASPPSIWKLSQRVPVGMPLHPAAPAGIVPGSPATHWPACPGRRLWILHCG